LIWINTEFNNKNVKHIFHTFMEKRKKSIFIYIRKLCTIRQKQFCWKI